MKNTNGSNGSEDWHVLCELASQEKDPEKLIALIVKINQVLDESHPKSPFGFYPNPVSFSASQF